MALTITNTQGVYNINGTLNSQNSQMIKNHFEMIMDQSAFIKLSLNNIIDLDKNGIKTIASIYNKAKAKEKAFFIVDLNNKNIENQFKMESITTY